MISEGSCHTEEWSNDVENTCNDAVNVFSFDSNRSLSLH